VVGTISTHYAHIMQFLIFLSRIFIVLFIAENCVFQWQVSAVSLCIFLVLSIRYLYVYIAY
jgi:hypothetical protein